MNINMSLWCLLLVLMIQEPAKEAMYIQSRSAYQAFGGEKLNTPTNNGSTLDFILTYLS